jgi:hypothetical protein
LNTSTRHEYLGCKSSSVHALLSLVTALALPPQGVLVPGRSLAGVRLGETRAAVVARWGGLFGTCRGCPAPTLYFTYRAFEPQGAGVTLRRGRVTAVFTLWSPPGWRTTKGLAVGDNAARVTELYGALPRVGCVGYEAVTLRARGAVTAVYLRSEAVWGFALLRPSERVCR